MKVLLVSPLDPDVPGNLKYLVGGENTYSRMLLGHPPRGVKYIHLSEALQKGEVSSLPLHGFLSILVKLRILPLSSGTKVLRVNKPFDLVHCHGYSIKTSGIKIPVLLSDSSSNYLFLKDYVNWSEWRIKFGYLLRKFLFSFLGVCDADTNINKNKLIVFSNFAKSVHTMLGVSKKNIAVLYPGLPDLKPKPMKKGNIINILFVGIWFERKGGHLLLRAFENLSKKYKYVHLTIVGPVPKKYKFDKTRVTQKDYVSREKLMDQYFPNADIFVLVPPKIEGFGFVVLEAQSFGIATIVSKVAALGEIVDDGKTGFTIKPGSQKELENALEKLIRNKKLREKMGEESRKRFLDKFDIKKSNGELLKIYREAILNWRQAAT